MLLGAPYRKASEPAASGRRNDKFLDLFSEIFRSSLSGNPSHFSDTSLIWVMPSGFLIVQARPSQWKKTQAKLVLTGLLARIGPGGLGTAKRKAMADPNRRRPPQ